jgi:hypothetical protein
MEYLGDWSLIFFYIAVTGIIAGLVSLGDKTKHPRVKEWSRSIFYLMLALYLFGSFSLFSGLLDIKCEVQDAYAKLIYICQ